MSTLAPAAPAPAPVAPVAPAPSVTPATFRTDAQNVAPDALNQLLSPSRPVAPAPAAPTAAPVAPAVPEGQAPVTPAQPAAPAQPAPVVAPEVTDPEAALNHARNWRVEAKDFQEAQVLSLTRPREGRPGLSLRDAMMRVYGPTMQPAAPMPQPAQPAAPLAPQADPTQTAIDRLNNEVVQLQQQAEQKLDKEADFKAAFAIQREISAKERQIDRLNDQRTAAVRRAEEQRVETAVSAYQQQQRDSAQRVISEFPAMADPAGEARAVYNLKVQELRAQPHWRPVFDSPEWPGIVARMVAEEQRWSRGQAPAPAAPAAPAAYAPVQPAPSAVARVTAAEIITPSSPSNGTASLTRDQALQNIRSGALPPDQLNQLLAAAPRK